jgi:hypothetical protein
MSFCCAKVDPAKLNTSPTRATAERIFILSFRRHRVGADALLRQFGFQFVALKSDDLLVFVRISQVSPLLTKSHL